MNPETLKDVLCCGQPASIMPDKNGDIDGFGVWCNVCKHAIHNPDKETAIKIFLEGAKKAPVNNQQPKNKGVRKVSNQGNQLVISPKGIESVFKNKQAEITAITSPILSNNQGAMERLMTTNTVRYPLSLTGKAWDKVWNSPVGQQSIVKGIEDAMIMGLELGKMGDLVPFGESCQLIPAIEAYGFCLTNGNNAPFDWIKIECIYENDEVTPKREAGNFSISFDKIGIPRGKVVAVATYAMTKTGDTIGEIYDAERLIEKAEAHSSSYQYYLRDKKQAEALRAEGKLLKMYGREYFEKSTQYGNKKIFLDELTNPYDGADRPEMLRKTAGKSFFAKFVRVRNSEAAMDEVRSQESGVDRAMDMAEGQFPKDVTDSQEVVD